MRHFQDFDPRTNRWGVAGFTISLLGLLLTAGILCPIGFIVSCIGLREKNKSTGLAVAGAIIGFFGSVPMIVVAVLIAAGGIGTVAREASAKRESAERQAAETINAGKGGAFAAAKAAVAHVTQSDGLVFMDDYKSAARESGEWLVYTIDGQVKQPTDRIGRPFQAIVYAKLNDKVYQVRQIDFEGKRYKNAGSPGAKWTWEKHGS